MQPPIISPKRFTESVPGAISAILLAILWIASMTMTDSNIYSTAPYVAGLIAVVAVWGVGLLAGYKTVQVKLLTWLSLAAGAYFLCRCHMSYSKLEALQDAGIILGCFVFYMAGVYAGQGGRSGWLTWAILAALLINLASLAILPDGGVLPWSLRPECGVTGPTAKNTALFTYKNFAGFFLMTAGLLPLARALCLSKVRLADLMAVVIGLAAVAASFQAGTRSVWLLLPCLLVLLWLLRFLVSLAENRRIGIPLALMGVALFIAGALAAYDFLFEHTLVDALLKVDSHLRTMAWELGYDIAPAGGWLGYGARASQWEIVQRFNDWCTPNMLHNEYLQAWVDYGLAGVSLVGAVLLLHLVAGVRQLTAEPVSSGQRAKAGMALLYLMGAALYAICDFGWHQPALAAGTAFACGILASPYPRKSIPWSLRWRMMWRNWAPGSGSTLVPVRSQKLTAKAVLFLIGIAVALDAAYILQRTAPAWAASWCYNDMVHSNTPGAEKLALLEETHACYPDSKLVDHYVLQPMPGDKGLDQLETMLKQTLEANPRQVFMAIMLADLWGREGRFEEAERLLRQAYDGDGSGSCRTNSWAFFYAFNLIRWGQKKMFEGDFPTALSMLEHGFTIANSHEGRLPNTTWRGGFKPWENGHTKKFRKAVFDSADKDLKMLRSMGVQADHSWKQPLEPGGKPALYHRWDRSKH